MGKMFDMAKANFIKFPYVGFINIIHSNPCLLDF